MVNDACPMALIIMMNNGSLPYEWFGMVVNGSASHRCGELMLKMLRDAKCTEQRLTHGLTRVQKMPKITVDNDKQLVDNGE